MEQSKPRLKIKARLLFQWFYLWVGIHVDTESNVIHICLLPAVVLKIWWWHETFDQTAKAAGWREAVDYITEYAKTHGVEKAIDSAMRISKDVL